MSISPSPDEDGEYFCRVILKSSGICFTPSGINFYRKHLNAGSSLSTQHSLIHARGALRSLQLKEKHLLSVEDSERVRKLIAEHYSEFVYMYCGQHPELARLAFKNMEDLGYPDVNASGGKTFQALARIIGFRNAIRLKKYT